MENSFNIGDVVKLAIDGPKMIITAKEEDGHIKCFWFNKHHQPQTEIFDQQLLVRVEENRPAGFFNR